MATTFKLPELGENVTSGTIAKVLVENGGAVTKDQAVLEIETDKAVVEIPSPYSGQITKLYVKDGDTVNVGSPIFDVDEAQAGASPSQEAPAAAPRPEPPAPTPQPASTAAPSAPVESAPPRRPALQVYEAPSPQQPAPASAPQPVAARAPGTAVLASPTVRRTARELGVDLAAVPTADPSGRVTMNEVLMFARGDLQPASETNGHGPATGAPAQEPRSVQALQAIEADRWGNVGYEDMSTIRKKTAERMASNWATIPHVTHNDKADITALEALRKKAGKAIEAAGGKLTVTSFLLKVVAAALQRYPKFNASLDTQNERIVYKQYYHIGVAADTPNGLLVPVIRDVDQKTIRELSNELPELAQKARERKLSLEEMQGGTFTISNLGGLGGNSFTPIINAPEVAILGVSRAAYEPVLENGVFAPRLLMPLSLSYDHRLIDGADAARFTRWICEAIEQPWTLFLEP